MDDPGKNKLRHAIKEMALASSRKVWGERQYSILSTFCMNAGAADKAAIQLVEVQPYQLPVSDA